MRVLKCLSVPRIWLFSLCLLPSLFFVPVASAEPYHWKCSSSQSCSSQPSLRSAANQAAQLTMANFANFTFVSCRFITSIYGACTYREPHIADPSLFNEYEFYAQRHGDSCASGATYNAVTGACDAPPPDPCLEKAAQTQNFFAKAPPGSSSLSGEYVCIASCRASWSGQCGANDAGESACWGLATFTGTQCQTGDTPSGNPPPPDTPDTPSCGPDHVWSGTTCVPKQPDNPDDPGGPEPCEGEDCPPPCEGEDCPDDGGDNGGGDNGGGGDDGGGDDGGDDGGSDNGGDTPTPCDPATDPAKCGQSSVAGESCDQTSSCNGDAIQCAIFRQQKAIRCADEKFRTVDAKAVAEVRQALDAEFSGAQYQPLTATAENTFDMSSVLDTSSRFAKACPVIPDISFPWIDGKTQAIPLSTLIADLCTYLTWMGYLVVAFAMYRAAQIIAEGMN